MWDQMHIQKQALLRGHMATSLRHWDLAEWQSRASLRAHGCSSWGYGREERLTDHSRTYVKGLLGDRSWVTVGGYSMPTVVHQTRNTGCSSTDLRSLEGVGFTARNLTQPSEGVHLSAESRTEDVRELDRDMRNFDPGDEAACRPRCALFFNVAQRHT